MPSPSLLIDGCVFVPTTGGTGSFVELSALGGYQTMEAAGALDQQQFSYRAQSGDLSQWEIGTGIWTVSTKTLTRVPLFNSLGTTAAINFTTPPQVLVTALASDIAPPTMVYLSQFGVTFGASDDTAALNAAFASVAGQSATVVFDKIGICKTSAPIIVGSNTYGVTSFINIYSPWGFNQSGINYTGAAMAGAALQVQRCTFFRFIGFGVAYHGGNNDPPGATIGIRMGGQGGADQGNSCHGIYWEGLSVYGFGTGITDGNSGGVSEVCFNTIAIGGCTVGCTWSNFNSLDFVWINSGAGGCGTGFSCGASESMNFIGGSCSGNTVADFVVDGTYTIEHMRSENSTLFLSGTGGDVHCIDCRVQATTTSINGKFGVFKLDKCNIEGTTVFPSDLPANVTMVDCKFKTVDATTGLPFTAGTTGGPTGELTRLLLKNNIYTGASPPVTYRDFDGLMYNLALDIGGTSVALESCGTVFPAPNNFPTVNAAQSLGVSYQTLSHVRQLSEAGMPGSVNYSVTNAQSINTPGQNLRVQAKFASAASVAVTFVRTVTTSASGNVLTSTAAFFPSDAGKPISVAGQGTNGWTNWYGYIVSYTDASHVQIQAASGQNRPSFAAQPAVIGANEPDGNYMVLVTGNVNETFWVDTITSTGFTVHSSNATSTATVTCLIVR